MIITEIRRSQKRLRDIYVDGEYYESVDLYILGISGLKEGDIVTKELLESLVEQSNDYCAYNRALYYLKFRDYTCKELSKKLQATFPERCVEKTIEKLKDLNFLDDERLAEKYLKVFLFEKHFSKKRAEIQLIKKGIDMEIASRIVENIDVDEKEQIKFLIDHKYKNIYKDEKEKNRAILFLHRHGYSFSDINSVLLNSER